MNTQKKPGRLFATPDQQTLIDALRLTYAVPDLLTALALPRSSYFSCRDRMRFGDKHTEVRQLLADIFQSNRRCYGYRRMRASLHGSRICISEKVVRRSMKQASLIAAAPKRRRYGSYSGEISPAPENLIDRDFRSAAPNEKWLIDITKFQIPAGKENLSPMIDCFDGLVVSWTLGTSPDAALANTMLDTAIQTVRGCSERPIVHSDRGPH